MNRSHSKCELSVVIPLYNEEAVVGELHERLKAILDQTGRAWEIIFVDDGSKDRTYEKALLLQKADHRLMLIKLRGNFGQTAALAAGFEHAAGDIIIAMDGDLQHLPEDIPKFLEKMDEGFDIVSGWRENRKDPFLTRKLPSKIANRLMSMISGIRLHDFGTTFKAYRREILENVHLYGEFHRFIPVLASWMKANITEIPIENIRQAHRKSHYNIGRTITVFFDLIRLNFLTKYLAKPLQVFGSLGFFLELIGVGIAAHLVYMKYVHGLPLMEYRAPLFILSLLLIVLGVLFIVLGLLGEMIVKLFYDYTGAKLYSIAEISETRGSEDEPCSEG